MLHLDSDDNMLGNLTKIVRDIFLTMLSFRIVRALTYGIQSKIAAITSTTHMILYIEKTRQNHLIN